MTNPIAYLILCHTDARQLYRLVSALDMDADFYVHIDLKTPLESFQKYSWPENVRFLPSRIRVYWAGFSIVEATIYLLSAAVKSNEYVRLVLLNGLDYPIKPTAYIVSELTEDRHREFIRFFDVQTADTDHNLEQIRRWYFADAPRWLVNRYFDGRGRLSKTMSPFRKKVLQPYKHCFGHMQWAISGSCARYILKFINETPKFSRFYRYSFAPDEHFFHTIVANSPFCEAAGGIEPFPGGGTFRMANLHHIHPSLNKTYAENDFEELVKSDKLFTKKITTKVSYKLLQLIDQRLR